MGGEEWRETKEEKDEMHIGDAETCKCVCVCVHVSVREKEKECGCVCV